jgi:hypothetical protein
VQLRVEPGTVTRRFTLESILRSMLESILRSMLEPILRSMLESILRSMLEPILKLATLTTIHTGIVTVDHHQPAHQTVEDVGPEDPDTVVAALPFGSLAVTGGEVGSTMADLDRYHANLSQQSREGGGDGDGGSTVLSDRNRRGQ